MTKEAIYLRQAEYLSNVNVESEFLNVELLDRFLDVINVVFILISLFLMELGNV